MESMKKVFLILKPHLSPILISLVFNLLFCLAKCLHDSISYCLTPKSYQMKTNFPMPQDQTTAKNVTYHLCCLVKCKDFTVVTAIATSFKKLL